MYIKRGGIMILTVGTRKGGTGKSTISYNLGFTYAIEKKKVLFIDLDSQANLTLACNVNDIPLNDFKDCKIQQVNEYIDILPASIDFKTLENEINGLINRNVYIKKEIIAKVKDNYDIIIIDTPPALNILNINAFIVSDYIIIPVNPDFYSLNALKEMKIILNEIKELNPKLEYKIVLNAYMKNRNFLKDIIPVLKNEPNYTGIEIPHRQCIIDNSALKKPSIDHKEIYEPLKQIIDMLKEGVKV